MIEDVKYIMAKVFRTSMEEITPDLNQKNVAFWDSLRHLNLVVELEEKYKISFEPEEIAEMTSFERVIYYLTQKLEKK